MWSLVASKLREGELPLLKMDAELANRLVGHSEVYNDRML